MEYLLIALGILLLAGLTAATFLTRRGGTARRYTARRSAGRDTRPELDPAAGPVAGRRPVGAEDAPGGVGTPGSTTIDLPAGFDADLDDFGPITTAGAAPGTVLDQPEPTAGRLIRLRARLARSQTALGRGLLSVLSRDKLDDQAWEDVEDALLTADVGLSATNALVERLKERTRVLGTRSQGELRALLADELVRALQPELDRSLNTMPSADAGPAVVLVVGVNGTGKTTTCGKLARVLVADGRRVLLGAADTFRAAAADQLTTWGARVGAETVRGPEGGDPASVAFDAVRTGAEQKVDVVLIDTAGRLHTKVGLMDELGKVKRVLERQGPVNETLLVLDATTGQNGLVQARVFTEIVDVTGIVLTKLDGTAKGGIVISVQRELGVPVKLIGLGEGPDDLAPFDPEAFVDALLGDPA